MNNQEYPQIQISNSNQDNCCFIFLLGYFSLMLLVLISYLIYVIEAISQNQDQEQIIKMGALIIIISIFMCIMFVIYIYQLKTFYYNSSNSKFIENFYKTKNNDHPNTTFLVREEQMKYLPFHYFSLIFGVVLILLTIKLRPTQKKFCKEFEYCFDCPDEDTPQGCSYIVVYDPEYEGPLLYGLSNFSIIMASLIFFFEFIMLWGYLNTIMDLDSHPKTYKNEYIKKVKTQATICLSLFFCYSVFKIILYIVIMKTNKNQTEAALIASNISFHSLILLIIFRTFYLVYSSKNGFYGNFYNCMTLIYEIVEQDRYNKILNFFGLFSIPIAIYGAVQFSIQENQQDIINADYFIFFDCLGVQIFAVGMILILQFILPCFSNPKLIQIKKQQAAFQKVLAKQQKKMEEEMYERCTKLNDETMKCVICQQIMKIISIHNVVRLKCNTNHTFHRQCISKWLNNHDNCPLCNSIVKAPSICFEVIYE